MDVFNDIVLANALEAADQIVAISKSPDERIRIAEPVFKEKLLPFLLNVNDDPKVRVDYWVTAVCRNNPNREVDVIDPNNGEILFTVPAVFNNTTLFDWKNSKRSLSDIMYQTKLIGMDNKLAAKMFVEQEVDKVMQPTDIEINLERWRTIYRYYGLLKTPESEKKVENVSSRSNATPDSSEIIYDDD